MQLHMSSHKMILWATLCGCHLLDVGLRCGQAATPSSFISLNCKESLPPLSLEQRTNGVRLRFAGNPSQKFSIQRAPAPVGPWTTIASRTAPLSALLQYEDTSRPPGSAFYRTAYTNSGQL